MSIIDHLFESNRKWVENRRASDPDFFNRLAAAQTPKYLWIGCSDSRVPANEIVDQPPGQIFVHRNVANLVVHTDLNLLSVLQYAVEVLSVEHVIICGHYNCGGVQAVLDNERHGLIDNWLRNVHDVQRAHGEELMQLDRQARFDRLCELNVLEQVRNVATTSIVGAAWSRGQQLCVHGWIYSLQDGLLRDLGFCVTNEDQLEETFEVRPASI